MSTLDAARARWRADLHEIGAAALRQAGLTRMAEASEVEVLLNREYADMMDGLAAAKEAKAAGALSGADYREVAKGVAAYRKDLRENGPVRPGVVDNFSEPSDDELKAMGY